MCALHEWEKPITLPTLVRHQYKYQEFTATQIFYQRRWAFWLQKHFLGFQTWTHHHSPSKLAIFTFFSCAAELPLELEPYRHLKESSQPAPSAWPPTWQFFLVSAAYKKSKTHKFHPESASHVSEMPVKSGNSVNAVKHPTLDYATLCEHGSFRD